MMFPELDIVPMSKMVTGIMEKIVTETIEKAEYTRRYALQNIKLNGNKVGKIIKITYCRKFCFARVQPKNIKNPLFQQLN